MNNIKHKKVQILTIILIFCSITLNAQIKIHSDNHISLMSETKSGGVQIQPTGYTYFATSTATPWGWVTQAYTNNIYSKCWIVSSPTNRHTFFVTGSGWVYKVGTLTLADANMQINVDEIDSASIILDQLTGIYYELSENNGDNFNETKGNSDIAIGVTQSAKSKRSVGLSAQEVVKILPEAVAEDADGVKYINYEVLTTFLIEGFKEQGKKIDELYTIIKELQGKSLKGGIKSGL